MGECEMNKVKTAQDAYDYYGGVWPTGANDLVTTGSRWQGEKNYIGVIEPRMFEHVIDRDYCWVICCNREEFEACAKKEAPYMPQVGEECEYRNCRNDSPANSLWWEAFYVGDSIDGYKIMQCLEGRGCKHMDESDGDIYEFRPLKTEREKFIIEGIDDLKELNPFESQGGLLGMLFDKGYRKNERD
jgi:hypothetical protein